MSQPAGPHKGLQHCTVWHELTCDFSLCIPNPLVQFCASTQLKAFCHCPCVPVVGLQPCPANTVTDDQIPGFANPPDAVTGPDGCSPKPGYGWESGTATECAIGFYKEGYTSDPCQQCGKGLTTAATRSTSRTLCITMPGWQRLQAGDEYAVPCDVGSYAAGAGDICNLCPVGSSTLYPQSSNIGQCVSCSPGWGIDAGTGLCSQCQAGAYGPGGVAEACTTW